MTYMKAVEAGCDIIDTAMSPFALGTSQPATEVMVEAFKGTEFDTGLDQNILAEIADYFRPMREEALESGLMNPKVLGVNIKTLLYQVPGGMLIQPDLPVKRAAGQRTNTRKYLQKYRVFVKILVSRRLLHLPHRSLVHRLYSTY